MAKKLTQKTLESDLSDVDIEEIPMREEKTITYAELMPSQSSPDSFDPDQEASFQDWADALGTERSGYIMRAYRLATDEKGRAIVSGGQSVFLEAWPLDSVNYDELLRRLRDEYMLPGMQTMAVRLIVNKNGERGIKKNQVVYVQRPLRGGTTPETKHESVTELLRAIQENSQAQMQQLRSMMLESNRAPAQPVRDPMEMMIAMMGAMAPFISAVAGRPMQQGPSLKELADTMLTLKDLTGGGGGSDNGNTVLDIIKAVAPLAVPVMQSAAASAQERAAVATMHAQNPQPRIAAPAARNINQPAQPTVPTQTAGHNQTHSNGGEIPMFLLQIRPQIQQLCELAAQVPQPDPVQVAEMTLAQIPEQYDEELGNILFNEKFMTWLVILDSRVGQHREWFEALHAALKKGFDADDGPVVSPAI